MDRAEAADLHQLLSMIRRARIGTLDGAVPVAAWLLPLVCSGPSLTDAHSGQQRPFLEPTKNGVRPFGSVLDDLAFAVFSCDALDDRQQEYLSDWAGLRYLPRDVTSRARKFDQVTLSDIYVDDIDPRNELRESGPIIRALVPHLVSLLGSPNSPDSRGVAWPCVFAVDDDWRRRVAGALEATAHDLNVRQIARVLNDADPESVYWSLVASAYAGARLDIQHGFGPRHPAVTVLDQAVPSLDPPPPIWWNFQPARVASATPRFGPDGFNDGRRTVYQRAAVAAFAVAMWRVISDREILGIASSGLRSTMTRVPRSRIVRSVASPTSLVNQETWGRALGLMLATPASGASQSTDLSYALIQHTLDLEPSGDLAAAVERLTITTKRSPISARQAICEIFWINWLTNREAFSATDSLGYLRLLAAAARDLGGMITSECASAAAVLYPETLVTDPRNAVLFRDAALALSKEELYPAAFQNLAEGCRILDACEPSSVSMTEEWRESMRLVLLAASGTCTRWPRRLRPVALATCGLS